MGYLRDVKPIYLFIFLMGAGYVYAKDEPVVGKAVNIQGQVLARNENGRPVRALKPGDPLYEGDILNTASNAQAKLLMEDKSILDIGGSTLFVVKEFKLKGGEDRQVDLAMGYGSVRAAVNKKVGTAGKFRIGTRSATMGVRGTEFVVASDLKGAEGGQKTTEEKQEEAKGDKKSESEKPKTSIVVVEGKVEVSTKKSETQSSNSSSASSSNVMLTPGQKLTTSTEALSSTAASPKVETVSAAEMKSITTETKVIDNTFSKSVVIDSGDLTSSTSSFSGAETLSTLFENFSSFTTSTDFSPRMTDFQTVGVPTFEAGSKNNNTFVNNTTNGTVTVKVVFKP